MDTTLLTTAFIALLAVLNPIGNLPVFIGVTAGLRPGVQQWLGVLIAFVIAAFLVTFVFLGEALLHFFGITIPAFQIAGGVVVLLMGLDMVRGHAHGASFMKDDIHDDDDRVEAEMRLSRILVPVAVPIFVGPGSISTIVLYANHAQGLGDLAGLAGVCIAATVVVMLTLLSAHWIARVLGKNGLDIATRILGLILCAIAVQFMLSGIQALYPATAPAT